ncbi:MAG: LLM class F420-dependent oxidoreductase, partial [Mycobacterium sp.]
IVGDTDYVRKQIAVWEAAGVTTMVVTPRSADEITHLGELVLH